LPGPKVFVSYSHKDEKALEQLQRYLHPLERDGLFTAWADTRLQGGDDWKKEIDQALAEASVAVLLISQDFLNSKFITEEEVPRVLAREAVGKMTVLPVFLGPSYVAETGFPDPRTSGRDKILLTKFQGYGKPDHPLSDLEWSAKERIYFELSRRLRTLAGAGPAASSPAPLAASATAAAGPARLFELTVQLEIRGESLQIQYHRPGLEPIASAILPWADWKQQIDPYHKALDTALNRALLPDLGTWGTFSSISSSDRWNDGSRFSAPCSTGPQERRGPTRSSGRCASGSTPRKAV